MIEYPELVALRVQQPGIACANFVEPVVDLPTAGCPSLESANIPSALIHTYFKFKYNSLSVIN